MEIRWDLGRIYAGADAPAFAADERAAGELAAGLLRHRGTIEREDLSAGELAELLAEWERFESLASRLAGFASLQATVDQADPEKVALQRRMGETVQRWRAELVFLPLELGRIPAPALARLVEDERLAPYRHFLARQQALARYKLSEAEERVAARKDIAGRHAHVRFRQELSAKLDFGRFRVDGEERPMTEASLRSLRFHPAPEVREGARRQLLQIYRGQLDTFGFLYANVVKDHGIECELRGFARPMDAENVPNEIPGGIVDALVRINRERLAFYHELYAWRAGRLGRPRLKSSDLDAPVTAGRPPRISWEQAVDWVAGGMRAFDGRFAALGERILEETRVDATPRAGKEDGAFCAPVPERGPFVFVNFTGDLSATVTLAHELGHAIHFLLSEERQTLFGAFEMSKVLAEVASEFNELLLVDRMLAESKEPALRQALLAHMVNRFLAVVDRQLMLTEFEEAAHAESALRPLGIGFLNDTWARLCREHFGPQVDLLEEDPIGWALVPHFVFNPFYCYSYALSQIAVMALFAAYREQGSRLAPGYMELLAAGGTGSPQELLARAGVDLSRPETLRRAFDIFEGQARELMRVAGDGPLS